MARETTREQILARIRKTEDFAERVFLATQILNEKQKQCLLKVLELYHEIHRDKETHDGLMIVLGKA